MGLAKKKVGLRLERSGPSDESKGPDLISWRSHHSHKIKNKELKKRGSMLKGGAAHIGSTWSIYRPKAS